MFPYLMGYRLCDGCGRLLKPGAKVCPQDPQLGEPRLLEESERAEVARRQVHPEMAAAITQCAANEEAELILLGTAWKTRVEDQERMRLEIEQDLAAWGYEKLEKIMSNPENYGLKAVG